jgi:hypothetical protein
MTIREELAQFQDPFCKNCKHSMTECLEWMNDRIERMNKDETDEPLLCPGSLDSIMDIIKTYAKKQGWGKMAPTKLSAIFQKLTDEDFE